jgi:hypothetical protein
MKRYERQGVREPRDLSKWDTWKKLVIGTRRRFEPLSDEQKAAGYGGDRYFFEEASWPKEDGSPRIVAQVQPDFGTSDDDGAYLWSVSWEFPDGAWRDHGKIDGRKQAKDRCIALVGEGSKSAWERRQEQRKTIVAVQQEAWPEPPADDGDENAEWRQVKPRRTRSKHKRPLKTYDEGPIDTYDDVPD